MTNEEVALVARRALADFARRLDGRLITRAEDLPYLWRGYLLGDDSDHTTNAFLHKFVSSDEVGELHFHPWDESISFILLGEYEEVAADGQIWDDPDGSRVARLSSPRTEIYRPGMKNVIKANTFHRVALRTPDVWTLFIHGPRVQPWGFVQEGTYGQELAVRVVHGKTSAARRPVAVGEVGKVGP